MSGAGSPWQSNRRQFLKEAAAAAGLCAVSRLAARGDTTPPATATPLHEASFYERLENAEVLCRLCPRACRVADGERGYCRVRENRGGRYYSLVYGQPCAMAMDPIEKKPFFHVYPGTKAFSIATAGCNLACKFCQNWDISQAAPEDVSARAASPPDIARQASQAGARAIAYTYGEPIVFYEYVADCARAARDLGIDSVMVSNGSIEEAPLKALLPLLAAVKIDLKAFTESFYGDICDGRLQPVLDTIRRIAASGTWLEIVVLLIPGLNDAEDEIRRLAAWVAKECGRDVPVHVTRFHPQYRMRNLPPTPYATLGRARAAALAEGLRFVYAGNAPGLDGESTVCPRCGAVAVKRYGFAILENTLVQGCCAGCGEPIPGRWT